MNASLWRPFGFTAPSVCAAILFLRETKGADLHAEVGALCRKPWNGLRASLTIYVMA